MPLKSYAVLKGRPKATRSSLEGHPHFQLQIEAAGVFHRAAINVRSMLEPSEMEYLIKLRFGHPIISALHRLPPGLHPVEPKPGGLALDYIRLNLFPHDQFLRLPAFQCGGGSDLNHVLEGIFAGAIADPDCWVYIYGEPWAVEGADHIFRFNPSQGMHDVHMNQGNDSCHLEQDGTWQDGAVLIEHSRQRRWTGLFLKFQSQSWHTDAGNGHILPPPGTAPAGSRQEATVRIAALLVNPAPNQPSRQAATLLNISPKTVDLAGWRLMGQNKMRWPLRGRLASGEAREFVLDTGMELPRTGGILTLVNHEGQKVHGVYFNADQAAREGWRIAF
jgi:uncharacterized protein YukJ